MVSPENQRSADIIAEHDSEISEVQQPKARVLIVDDNHVNLDTMKSMMKFYSIRADCVDNGQKAVAAVSSGNFCYNAVFMDYLMPEMDGIATTRAIRNIGSDYALKLPIIALTADDNIDNENMFLNNDFQAYLIKPIDIESLHEVILQWVQTQSSLSGQTSDITTTTTNNDKLKDLHISGLDITLGLARFGGDVDAYIDVLRSYTANTRRLLVSIEYNDGIIPTDYMIIIHGIKGSSRSIFANEIAIAAELLEKAYARGDFGYVTTHNSEFIKNLDVLISELEKTLTDIAGADKRNTIKKPDPGVLDDLLLACESYDMNKIALALNKLEKYDYEYDNEIVIWIRENVDLMNFTDIAEKLRMKT